MNHYELIEAIRRDVRVRAAFNVESLVEDLQDKEISKRLQVIFSVLGETTREALKNGQDVVLTGIGQLVHAKNKDDGDSRVVRFRASSILKQEVGIAYNKKGAKNEVQI